MSTSATAPGAKRKLPRSAWLIGTSAAMLGVIYGYDQSNIAGAQLFIEQALNVSTEQIETIATAVPYGMLIGTLLGGSFSNRFGRKSTTLAVVFGYVVFCLAQAAAWDFTSMMVSRVLLGFTIGVSLIAVPVFIAESVAARVRGGTLVMYQVAGVCGIIIALVVAFVLRNVNPDTNWRWMLGVAAIPAVALLPLLLKVPETSRWLMMKGRRDEALASLTKVDPEVDQNAVLDDIQAAIDAEKGGAFSEMLRRPYLRATVFVVVLGLLIQITGINATITYGPKIFKAMGYESTGQQLSSSLFVQICALIAVLISMRVVDRWGRRPILKTGIGIMILAQVMMVITFATVTNDQYASWQKALGFAGLALINVGFVFGFGALVWVYSSESFPARLRAYGAGAMMTADIFGNILIVQFFLTVMNDIGGATSFGIFGVLAVFALFFVHKFAPETKGREVDEIRHFWENGGKWPAKTQSVGGSAGGKAG